jgi:uncharacterized membrane protein YgdD (TMEM256/DUF423 family)
MAVILGAFGAHGLKDMLPARDLDVFETGVRYQMYHALFLLLTGSMPWVKDQDKKWVLYLITAGVICFSFSLYMIATRELTGIPADLLGLLTPVGGLLFILGWAMLGYRIYRHSG